MTPTEEADREETLEHERLRTQDRQTNIGIATGGPRIFQRRNHQRTLQRRNHQRTLERRNHQRTLQRRNHQRTHQRRNKNASNNDEIINGESIPIYSFIVLKYLFTMVCLEEIAAFANILTTAPSSTVQLLYKIVNDKPYSKSSRKELKKFADFRQNYDIEAQKDKILKDFTKTELFKVCTILALNYTGRSKQLIERIFENLSDISSLKNNFTEQLTDDEDGDSAPFSLESVNDVNKQPLTLSWPR
ncbi:hypothetical protein TNCV_762691 [Trichonephila clavipes]|nr:hypothetical protein TNCV_762691 [Trichonephila clavipes]